MRGETVLYEAGRGAIAYLRLILPIAIVSVLVLPWAILFATAGGAESIAVAVGLMLFVLAVSLGAIWSFQSPLFRVTSSGIETRGSAWWGVGMTTQRIAWSDVDHLELATRFPVIGAVVVVTRDGRRVVAPVTSGYRALFRGESSADHGSGFRLPAAPMRAAIDGLERYRASAHETPRVGA